MRWMLILPKSPRGGACSLHDHARVDANRAFALGLITKLAAAKLVTFQTTDSFGSSREQNQPRISPRTSWTGVTLNAYAAGLRGVSVLSCFLRNLRCAK